MVHGSALLFVRVALATTLALACECVWAQAAQPEPDRQVRQATALIAAGKIDDAIALLENQATPGAKNVEATLAKAYYRKRDLDKAIPHFYRALGQNPKDKELTQLLALSLYSTAQYERAIPLLESFRSSVATEGFDTAYVLGMCYLKVRRIDKAREAFANMYSVPEGSATAHLLLAQMMVRQHHEEEAQPEVEAAISIDSRLPMAHFLLGEIHLYKSRPEAALNEFKEELALNPSVWLVYWRTGDALARLERYDEAERALKQAIWLNETFSAPYVLLGQIALKKGDLELALGFLERAVKMDPNNSKAHYSLARAYERAGHLDRAKEQFGMVRSSLRDRDVLDDQR